MAGASSPVSPIFAITSHDDDGMQFHPPLLPCYSSSPLQSLPARRRPSASLSPSPSPECRKQEESVLRRPFCKRCWKPEKLCICQRLPPEMAVESKARVVILQHPEERKHPIGSARVALLGIKNLTLIPLPESTPSASVRNRPKVPGSKRSARGRCGKGSRFNRPGVCLQSGIEPANGIHLEDGIDPENRIVTENGGPGNGFHRMDGVTEKISALCLATVGQSLLADNGSPSNTSDRVSKAEKGNSVAMANKDMELGMLLQDLLFAKDGTIAENLGVKKTGTLLCPGIGLLFPSERAMDLSRDADNSLTHLIVLDGTWSKAKRLLFENPWLQALPHYKLPGLFSSIYEGVRKAPKPGCLSTLESIVYALKILEPETEGLDELLCVFDSMVDDQRRFKEIRLQKHRPIGIDETKV